MDSQIIDLDLFQNKKLHPMKIKFTLTLIGFLGIFLPNKSESQTLVNTTGNTISSINNIIEYSVGEISITTLSSPGVSYVTQGLLQPDSTNGVVEPDSLAGRQIVKNQPKWIAPDSEILRDALLFFPNPTNNYVTVLSTAEWLQTYQVYALNGKLVRIASFANNNIDMSVLPNGVYFIKIFSKQNNKSKYLKVIKQ